MSQPFGTLFHYLSTAHATVTRPTSNFHQLSGTVGHLGQFTRRLWRVLRLRSFVHKARDGRDDLVDDFAVGREIVRAAWQQDQPRTRNGGRQQAALIGVDREVFLTMNDECRNGDLSKYLAAVATR